MKKMVQETVHNGGPYDNNCWPEGVEILSAWRDEEPWFGLCTDMREEQQ